MPAVITRLPLRHVLACWRPGSFDRTWEEEFADLGSPARIDEMWGDFSGRLLRNALLHGQDCLEPVTLGWDGGEWNGSVWRGRVWAGHHRLWVCHALGWDQVAADVVPPGEARTGKAGHCAPA